jgi:hypothetical protein
MYRTMTPARCVWYVTGVVSLLFAPATSADAAGLGVVGGSAGARSVPLARDAGGRLTGRTNLALRNDSAERVRLTVRFFGDRSGRPRRVGTGGVPFSLVRTNRPVAPHAMTVVPLKARLAPKEPPTDLDGVLVVDARTTGGRPAGTTEVRVTGALALPTNVAFEPSTVTLQVTRRWPFHGTTGDQTTVRLRGPGVARFVASVGRLAARNRAAQPATLLLTNDAGGHTLVELVGLRQTSPDVAEVTVSTHAAVSCPNGAVECGRGAPAPGGYTGALAVAPGSDAGPKLAVTVHSQLWFVLPVLLVLLGSLLGGLLPQLTQTAEMKDRLRARLRPVLDRYVAERPQRGGPMLLWDLQSILKDEPWYEKRYRGLLGDGGVAELWASIHCARTMEDLGVESANVQTLCGHVQRWLQIRPLAEQLAKLHADQPPDRGRHAWRDTWVRRETEKMLRGLADRLPPKDDAEAQEIGQSLRNQADFHRLFGEAWVRRAELDDVHVSQNVKERDEKWWKRADLDALDADLAGLAASDPDMSERFLRLADVREAIDTLVACYAKRALPDEAHVAMSAERRAAVVRQLEAGDSEPEEIAKRASVPVEAVVDIRRDEPRTATPSAPVAPPSQNPVARRVRRGLHVTRRALTMTDWMVTILIAVGTAVAYMVPLYTGTWGSWEDWITAFAAGLAGQVAIKWALLPALRSSRLPQTGAGTAPAT